MALYGDLTVTPHRSHGHNIAIPSPYARRIPLFTHPSLIEEPKPGAEILEAVANFTDDLQTVIDPAWPDRNNILSPISSSSQSGRAATKNAERLPRYIRQFVCGVGGVGTVLV